MHFGYAQCKQKGFAPILILVGVLVLAIVAGGAYYFGKSQNSKPQPSNPPVISQTPQPTIASSSSPDETANWKTYTDDKFKISFKYLSIYTITELAENSIFLVRTEAEKKSLEDCFAKKQPECNSYSLSLYFEHPGRSPNLSLKEFVAMYTHTFASDYTPITVAGLPALQKQFEGIGTVNDVFIDKGKTVFYLRANSIINPQENMVFFNKILSTFKFTQ